MSDIISNLDALVGELAADRDRHKSLSECRLELLHKEQQRADSLHPNDDVLTKVEASAYLADGSLPDNFAERLTFFIESYVCRNCDGQQDMNVVMRDWFEDEPSWCPDCVGRRTA